MVEKKEYKVAEIRPASIEFEGGDEVEFIGGGSSEFSEGELYEESEEELIFLLEKSVCCYEDICFSPSTQCCAGSVWKR